MTKPKKSESNKRLLLICLSIVGAGLIWLSAQFEMSIPGSPVPQSGQTLAIVLVAALLPKPYGVLTVLFYLLAGLIGLPVFSDNGSGWPHLIGQTGGYLIGFLLAAIWIQQFDQTQSYKKSHKQLLKHTFTSFAHYLIAHGIILTFGFLWLSRFIGIEKAWLHGVYPFFSGALAKSLLALIIVYFTRQFLLKETN